MSNNNIANKNIVLKLNKNFLVVCIAEVSKTICDLMSGVVMALDINYKLNADGTPDLENLDYFNPVKWEDWIKLPVRPWDMVIHSKTMTIRVPTVVVTTRYSKVHFKNFNGKPTKEGLFTRDGGTDIYTNEELDYESATIDHIIPLYRGGTDTYDNTGLTTKATNNRKGHKLNSEAGLTLKFIPYHPRPILFANTIRKARHHDWKLFMTHSPKHK